MSAALVVMLALPAAASAAVRYAAPDGLPSPACSPAPCDLQTAVESAAGGDEVVVLPGTYVESSQLDVSASIFVHGVPDQPAPVIVTVAGTGIAVTGPSAFIRKLVLVHFGSGDGLVLDAGVAEQVVTRTTSAGFACQVRGGAALRDSICWSTGAGGRAAGTSAVGTLETASLRNVTAVGTGAGGVGLHAGAGAGGVADIGGFNVIAEGAGVDIASETDGASIASIDIYYSNFGTRSLVGTNAFAPTPGVYNQSDPPVFADAANGDFHEHPDSPTIERGTGEGVASEVDVDGEPRFQGYGIDIGADEYLVGFPPPDVNPPETKILKGPDERTKRHRARFKFGTSEPSGGTLMCGVDGDPYKQCKSPMRLKVGGGPHIFRVFSIDAAGNVDATPAERAWHVKRKHKKKKKKK